MKIKTINFAKEFTDCPGGRLRIYGEFSGEEFRENFLRPALAEFDKVVIDLNGVVGLPASFLDEAFGVLAGEMGLQKIHEKMEFQLADNPIALTELHEVMKAHTA